MVCLIPPIPTVFTAILAHRISYPYSNVISRWSGLCRMDWKGQLARGSSLGRRRWRGSRDRMSPRLNMVAKVQKVVSLGQESTDG